MFLSWKTYNLPLILKNIFKFLIIFQDNTYSPIAQQVERPAVNRQVAGSSPAWGAKQPRNLRGFLLPKNLNLLGMSLRAIQLRKSFECKHSTSLARCRRINGLLYSVLSCLVSQRYCFCSAFFVPCRTFCALRKHAPRANLRPCITLRVMMQRLS